MKTLTVRQLPITDLNIGFAIPQEDGKIRQYFASLPFLLTKGSDKKPEDLAFEILQQQFPDAKLILEPPEVLEGGALRAKILPEDRFSIQTIKALKSRKTNSLLYQFNYTLNQNIPNFIAKIYNTLIAWPYYWIARGYNKIIDLIYRKPEKFVDMDRFEYLAENDEIAKKYIRSDIFLRNVIRRVEPVRFLSIMTGEETLEKAIDEIAVDLDVLEMNGLIMGHMFMPSVMELANEVGNGKKIYAVFTSVIVDTHALAKKLNMKYLDLMTGGETKMYHLISEKLFVKNFVMEGGVGNWVHGKHPYEDLVISSEPMLAQTQHSEGQVTEAERLYKQMLEDTKKAQQRIRERGLAKKKDDSKS